MRAIASLTLIVPAFILLLLASCRQPVFEHEQPPFVLHRYYSRCILTGHQAWWWNVAVNGKQLVLPDGETDLDICHLGPAKNPPNLLIMVKNQYYLVRVIDGMTDILPFPKSQYEPGGWANDGRVHVFKFSMIDISNGVISELKPYQGRFLGFSPDGKDIVSVTCDSGNFTLIRTDRQDGRTRLAIYDSAEYAWLGDWGHHAMPVYAPNLWIFSNIQWKENDNHEYEMIIPKMSVIQDKDPTENLPICRTGQSARKHLGKKVRIEGLYHFRTFYGKKNTVLKSWPVVLLNDSQEVMIGSLWLDHEKPAESDRQRWAGKNVAVTGILHGQPPGHIENFSFLCVSPVDSLVLIQDSSEHQ